LRRAAGMSGRMKAYVQAERKKSDESQIRIMRPV
jgi:hypothetical protein